MDVVFYQYTDKYGYFPSNIEEGLIRLSPYDDPACWSIDQVALSLWLRHCSRLAYGNFEISDILEDNKSRVSGCIQAG